MSNGPPCRREDNPLSNRIVPSDCSTAGHGMETDGSPPEHLPENEFSSDDQHSSGSSEEPSSELDTLPNFKQPKTNPIEEAQLISEVFRIYGELVLKEAECIKVAKLQTQSQAELSSVEWQEKISSHQSLLGKYYDFFLASQHPSASQALKSLAASHDMPARMWRFGIDLLLDLLRRKYPGSLDYIRKFIDGAFPVIAQLHESTRAFREIWIECLGDLARYRMALEESEFRTHWAGIAEWWYNKFADLSPEEGRIQHHLGILARPDVLLQLFYYTKALVSIRPFPQTRESMARLFHPDNGQQQAYTMVAAFVATHSALFNEWPADQYITSAKHFLSLLREEARSVGHQGVYIMLCNFAAMLQYGDQSAVMVMEFSQKKSVADAYELALDSTAGLDLELKIKEPSDAKLDLSPIASQGSALAFHTLSVLLDLGDSGICPSVHVSLAFIWSLALHPPAMQKVDKFIPWANIVRFLNILIDSDILIEDDVFPLDDGTICQLPEDFLLRGQLWTQLYFPEKFFDGISEKIDRPSTEQPSDAISRKRRCLWLGGRIAKVGSNVF
ncbi:hypothetical protein PoHVEF18_003099 [Penicillium ochrochloron]